MILVVIQIEPVSSHLGGLQVTTMPLNHKVFGNILETI